MPALTSETSWLWSVCPIELSSLFAWTSVARSVCSHNLYSKTTYATFECDVSSHLSSQ